MLYTCPVLDVQRAEPWLALFRRCYRVRTTGMGSVWYERIALPVNGGIAEQPAKELAILDHIEGIATELLEEQVKRGRRQRSINPDHREESDRG